MSEANQRSGECLSSPTDLTLNSPIYERYRALGYVSKDSDLRASPAEIAVFVVGKCCALNADGTIERE